MFMFVKNNVILQVSIVEIKIIFFLVSVYVILGHTYEHLGLIVAMEDLKLFDKGKCVLL